MSRWKTIWALGTLLLPEIKKLLFELYQLKLFHATSSSTAENSGRNVFLTIGLPKAVTLNNFKNKNVDVMYYFKIKIGLK